MTHTRSNRNELVQAIAGAVILLSVNPPARGEGGGSSVIALDGAGTELPTTITIEQVLTDPALAKRGAAGVIIDGVPAPAAPPKVLLAWGSMLETNSFAVYEDGAPSGEQLMLLPRTKASLSFGWRDLLDAEGSVAAQVQFSAELGTATLVLNGSGHHVMGLFTTHVVHPNDASSEPFAIMAVVLLGEVTDLVSASSFVIQVEAWSTPPAPQPGPPTIAPADEKSVAPGDEEPPSFTSCKQMCQVFDAAQKETCNLWFLVALNALFAEPYGGVALEIGAKPGSSWNGIPAAYLSLLGATADDLAPELFQALDEVSTCHDQVDGWTYACLNEICVDPL